MKQAIQLDLSFNHIPRGTAVSQKIDGAIAPKTFLKTSVNTEGKYYIIVLETPFRKMHLYSLFFKHSRLCFCFLTGQI